MVRPVQISGQKPVIYIYDYTYNSCLKSTVTTVTTFSFYCSEKANFPQKQVHNFERCEHDSIFS